jgi:hypothetical protein
MNAPILAGLWLLASIPLVASGSQWAKDFAVTGTPELHVKARLGNITIRAAGTGEIRARLSAEGWEVGPGGLQVTTSQDRGLTSIDIQTPREPAHGGGHAVALDIQVPPEAVVDVQTDEGRIKVVGMRGEARLGTTNGGIEVAELDGALEAKTHAGKIRFSGRFDRVNLETGDGSIEGEFRRGSRMRGDWRVETDHGHIRLGLPLDLAANLEAQSYDGDVKLSPDFRFNPTQQGFLSEAHGRLNDGGPTLLVRSTDGTIHLDPLPSQ